MSIKIKQLPETERPYEKLELYGAEILSNAELLAIIIKTGTKEETSVDIARRILNLNEDKKENLNFLRTLTIEEFKKIKGIGRVKAIQLKALCELVNRMSKPVNYRRIIVKKPIDVAGIFMEELRFKKIELVKLVILNNKNEIIKIKDLSKGGVNVANISMREILSEPLKMQAPKIILVHNHPTGDPTPSKADIEATKILNNLSLTLGIELVDHIVIGDKKFSSIFSEMLARNINF